jgi:hypothetical protein
MACRFILIEISHEIHSSPPLLLHLFYKNRQLFLDFVGLLQNEDIRVTFYRILLFGKRFIVNFERMFNL